MKLTICRIDQPAEGVKAFELRDAAGAAGVWVPYDCRRGECHMSMTQVVEGQPVHRDHCLSQEERETSMTPCVSWARGSP